VLTHFYLATLNNHLHRATVIIERYYKSSVLLLLYQTVWSLMTLIDLGG